MDTKAELSNQERLHLEAEELLSEYETWRKRWHVSLILGNGVGLLTTLSATSTALELGLPAMLVLPSLWLFSVGLIFSGPIPWLRMKYVYNQRHLRFLSIEIAYFKGHCPIVVGPGLDDTESSDVLWAQHSKESRKYRKVLAISEAVSAFCFSLGIFAPVSYLSYIVFTNG